MIEGTVQFGRQYQLLVASSTVTLDLSQLHFKFTVKSADVATPNTAVIRVYNVSPSTAQRIKQGEFSKIILSAGYQANVNFGVIFNGDIKHVHIGRESNVDNYVEVLAADGDLAYNFATVNTSVGPNSTPQQRFEALNSKIGDFGLTVEPDAASAFSATGGVLPRGAVLFGLWRTQMNELANASLARWSVQQGKVVVIPNTGYRVGEIVVLNSTSGLIGVPEVTDNGVNVRMLLNAKLRIGGLVNINQSQINQEIVQQQNYPNYNSLYFPAQVSSDGNYRVLVINHTGDTRGRDWYTDIVCLAVLVSPPGSTQQYECQLYPG